MEVSFANFKLTTATDRQIIYSHLKHYANNADVGLSVILMQRHSITEYSTERPAFYEFYCIILNNFKYCAYFQNAD